MTKEETIKIMAVLQANYPNSFKGMSREALEGRINLWYELFQDNDYNEVGMAVKAHIASDTNHFMPPIGVIKNKLAELKAGGEMTELEAWALVAKATRNGFYGWQEEFDKLPPQIQRAIGQPQLLKEWSQLPSDEVATVIQSNFMRSYRARSKSDKEYQALPSNVKAFLEGNNKLKIEG